MNLKRLNFFTEKGLKNGEPSTQKSLKKGEPSTWDSTLNMWIINEELEELEETSLGREEAEEAVQREIEQTVSEYRAGVKKDLLNRLSHAIAARKETGRYFFMGHWLKKNEISDFYRYMKKKDRVFVFYLFLCMFIFLILILFISLSFLPKEHRSLIFSFFSNLF